MRAPQVAPPGHAGDPRIRSEANHRPRVSVFVPVLLIALAVLVGLGFQSVQLAREWNQLRTAETELQPREQNAVKLRASLDAVATATAKLSTEGNSNARTVVDELRKRGVTINPPSASSPR
jgi:hypothetical protein